MGIRCQEPRYFVRSLWSSCDPPCGLLYLSDSVRLARSPQWGPCIHDSHVKLSSLIYLSSALAVTNSCSDNPHPIVGINDVSVAALSSRQLEVTERLHYSLWTSNQHDECRQAEMQTQTSGLGAKVLPEIPKECSGSEAQFKRVELSSLLRKHSKEQASESGHLSGEENSERRMEVEAWVRKSLYQTCVKY